MLNIKSIKLVQTAENSMTMDPEGKMKRFKLVPWSLIPEESTSIYFTRMLMGENDNALKAEKLRKVF